MAEIDIPPFIPPDIDTSLEDEHDEEVTAVHLLESPPRKRPRVTEQSEDITMPLRSPTEITRDPEYYMSDGSCILLVDNTLFNVHRTMLSKDNSSFGPMFTLPQGDQTSEGKTDDNPIVLTGDTVTEFRNFLWALYALPHELMLVHSDPHNLHRLIDIARVANKYSFKSLETWALDVIVETVTRKTSPPTLPFPLSTSSQHHSTTVQLTSSAQIITLVRLAQLCNHERLLTTMVDSLKKLMSSSTQNAYMAMTLADELDLRTLRGNAYLEVMQKASVVVKRPGDGSEEGDIDADGRLVVSQLQQLRLLSGYYRLTSAWERLRAAPPPFEHASSCGATWHQHGCTQSWQEFWREKTKSDAVLALGLADVLGRLKAISKEFDKWGSATYMHHDCRMLARRVINEKIKGVQDALPDYFMETD
ncbi:hypothetical protein DENSPDRAFT_867026 [Dentipellis sp. KUC8613]|nr:hypothetical protein DENSPDRAFT_867026 [Dentipellis sp. KUC8613]